MRVTVKIWSETDRKSETKTNRESNCVYWRESEGEGEIDWDSTAWEGKKLSVLENDTEREW